MKGKLGKGSWAAVVAVLVGLAGCGHGDDADASLGAELESGELAGSGISNTVSHPSEMSVGDIMPISFADGSGQAIVNFDGVSSSTEFIMIVGSSNTNGSGTSLKLANSLSKSLDVVDEDEEEVVEEDAEDDGMGANEIFHSWLRANESELSFSEPLASVSSSSSKALTKAIPSEGEERTFRVLSSLTSVSSYVEVDTEARCVGDRVVLYVDTRVSSDELSSEDIASLCAQYDDVAEREIAMLGEPSDVDNNGGRTGIVVTPQINYLGALGGGIITGYFFASDLHAQTTSNKVSNEGEFVYVLAPDPTGQWGTPISNEFAMSNLLAAVFPHELLHLLVYARKVLEVGAAPESSWLNEAMAHTMECVMGFCMENPSRYALYLSSPSSTKVITSASPDLYERGAGYLFLEYLRQQASDGEAFMKCLVESEEVGVDNLEFCMDGSDDFNQFEEFMGRWTVGLAVTNRINSQYAYDDRVYNASSGYWEGVCLSCEALDNRNTVMTGVHLSNFSTSSSATIKASAAKFYSLTDVPDEIVLSGSGNGGTFGMLIRSK